MGIALVMIGFIGLLLCTKITVQLQLVLHGFRPELSLEVRGFFRLLRKRIRWSYSEPDGSPLPTTPTTRRTHRPRPSPPRWTVHDGRAFWRIGRRFLRHVSVEKWETATVFGTGEAHVTGWLAGWLWSLQTQAQTLLLRTMKLRKPPRITIRPDFQRQRWFWRLDCITSFRLGHAIIAGIRLFSYWFWTRKRMIKRENSPGKGC